MKKEALKSVAIQGGLGAFHEIASRSYFDEKIKILSCETFQEIIDRLSSSEADFGFKWRHGKEAKRIKVV